MTGDVLSACTCRSLVPIGWVPLVGRATIYVNDAFGTAHRAHASTAGVTKYVQHSVAGLLLQKELKYMNEAVLAAPKRPLIAIVGGSKVSSKLPVLTSLMQRCDTIVIGGAMCFTFLKCAC